MTMDLALRSTVRELVATLSETEETVRRTFAELHAAEERCNALFVLGGAKSMRIDPSYCGTRGAEWKEPERVIERLRRAAWGCVVERLEIRRVLSDQAWKTLQHEIEKGEVEPLTEASIAAFVDRFAGDLYGLFQAKVTEVFNWLRPREGTRRAEYKTNAKNAREALGPRIVVTGVVELGYGQAPFRVRYYMQQELAALESVFRSLDGQGYGTSSYYGELHDAICKSDGQGESTYFAFRVFRNGNMHLQFRRLDLLEKLNAIAGGKNLKEGDLRTA